MKVGFTLAATMACSLIGACQAHEGSSEKSQGAKANAMPGGPGIPSLGLEPEEVCRLLGTVYNVAEGPSWVREKAPIFPSGYWLTSNDNVRSGTNFERKGFECKGNNVEMNHVGHIVFLATGNGTAASELAQADIRQKDVFTIHADGSVTDQIYFEDREGGYMKSDFNLHLVSLSEGKAEYGGTLPFPAPVCPIAAGLEQFEKCEIRLYHRAEVVDGQVSGYDGWTLVALDKAGNVLRSHVTDPTLSLSSDRSLLAK